MTQREIASNFWTRDAWRWLAASSPSSPPNSLGCHHFYVVDLNVGLHHLGLA